MNNVFKTFQIISIVFFPIYLYGADNSQQEVINIDDLIEPSSIIVIGEIDEIVNEGLLYGYNRDGSLKFRDDPSTGLPIIDYSINVEQILHDPKSLYDSGEIVLRLMGATDESSFSEYYDTLKGRSIFFLVQNPDGKTYGFRGFSGFIHIDQNQPRTHSYIRNDTTFFVYDDNEERRLDSVQLLQKLRARIESGKN